ncbi:hypothetical protein ACE102_03165 [Bradyrhizobium sp. vgs-9]|uniref:hypothetical protein n=1 Tax=Bradyrhizobium sp. vgs-9 TaxID=208389 RepID=UPI0035D4F832
MNKIVIPPNTGAVDAPRRLSVSAMMDQALKPFHVVDDLSDAIRLASTVRDLVARGSGGDLIALRTTDPAERWELHCRAYEMVEVLPAAASIRVAFDVVHTSITTRPTEREKLALIGAMLGGCGIRSTPDVDSYIQGLAWMLGDCAVDRDIEWFNDRKPWLPLPAIAAAVRKIWSERRDDYGRPVPIADFLDECRRYSSELVHHRSRVANLGVTHRCLSEIVKATEDSYPEED